jgi:uncharacterized membrane protein
MTARDGIRNAVLGATVFLIIVIACWILSTGLSWARALAAILLTLPLWILLPALVRGDRRRYAAMTLCLAPYLVIALTELVANPASRFWSTATLLLSFALFLLLIAFLRVTRPTLDASKQSPTPS